MSSVSNKLDYAVREYSHPSYKLHKIVANNGRDTVALTQTGGEESVFELPAMVCNLARSSLNFTLTVPVPGAANRMNQMYASQVAAISEISLYNAGGTNVVDLRYANNYLDIVSKTETKIDDMLTYDTGNRGQYLSRSNALAEDTPRYKNKLAQAEIVGPPLTPAAPAVTDLSNLNYTEHKYLLPGALNAAVSYVVQLPLSFIYNTMLSYDKDVFFGEIMYLRIRWAETAKIYFITQGVQTAVGVYDAAIALNPANSPLLGANAAISKLRFYLAYEDDLAIANAVKAAYYKGVRHRIPFVWSFKQNLGSTTQNVSIRYGPGQGRRLLKQYHALFNNTENLNLSYDRENTNDPTNNNLPQKLSKYYTLLNNARRQEFDVDVTQLDDYMINKDRLKGSVIQNSDIYLANYCVIDDFTEDDCVNAIKNKLIMGLDCGVPLDVEQKWDIYCTTTDAFHNHYSFGIVSRDLYLGPGGMRIQ